MPNRVETAFPKYAEHLNVLSRRFNKYPQDVRFLPPILQFYDACATNGHTSQEALDAFVGLQESLRRLDRKAQIQAEELVTQVARLHSSFRDESNTHPHDRTAKALRIFAKRSKILQKT